MRLLHAKSFEFKEFFDDKIPYYAILSHTWEEEEVSFQVMQGCHDQGSHVQLMKGFKKIKGCCAKAIEDGIDYVWIDTCCIDKSSSAELSEAINSMWKWYKTALVCYVYLSDVEKMGDDEDSFSSFRKSRWFTRGWTLQELVAPRSLIFYNATWQELGTKSSLRSVITAITKIPSDVLDGPRLVYSSVAQRMSWASDRQTSRVEDIAYCLMGLFGVKMPLLYGEGRQAFIRLQEEIIKKNPNDHTIFAWKYHQKGGYVGILCLSPAGFRHSHTIVDYCWATHSRLQISRPGQVSITNSSIQLDLPILPGLDRKSYIGALYCRDTLSRENVIGIRLERVGSKSISEFWRTNESEFLSIPLEDVISVPVTSLCIIRTDQNVDDFDPESNLHFSESKIELSTKLLEMGGIVKMSCPEENFQSDGYIPLGMFPVVGIQLSSSRQGSVVIVLKEGPDGEIFTAVTRDNDAESLPQVTDEYIFAEEEQSDRAVWQFSDGQLLTIATKLQIIDEECTRVILMDVVDP